MDSHLSPTNIANYYHNQCQLYLYNSFHRSGAGGKKKPSPSPLAAAQFRRGLAWEEYLFSTLDLLGQLVRVEDDSPHPTPKTAIEIRDIILDAAKDATSPKYLVNLAFQSPAFTQELLQHGSSANDVAFGVAKPDIVKVTNGGHEIIWEIIDAKASSALKASHNAQIGFYHLCLEKLLDSVSFDPDTPLLVPSHNVSIWMPGDDESTLSEPVATQTSLLLPPLRDFLFKRLPQILKLPRDQVEWHLNPSCQGCEFLDRCKDSTIEDKRLGLIPNLPLSDARFIREVLEIAENRGMLDRANKVTEIEELDSLIKSPNMRKLEEEYAPTSKRFQRLLGVQKNREGRWSPLLDAALTHQPKLTKKRVFTFPRSEDLALYISIITDVSSMTMGAFCLSITRVNLMSYEIGSAKEFVPKVSGLLRKLLKEARDKRIQVYTYSTAERSAIISHLIKVALSDQSSADMNEDIRLCLGALCEGTSLLMTTFQPVIMSGVLLSFLSKKNALSKNALQNCCERLGLTAEGTIEELRKRIEAEQRRLAEIGGRAGDDITRREVGQLNKVVVLKQEVERLLSLPIPGFVDLPQTAEVLLGKGKAVCLTDDALFGAWSDKRKPSSSEKWKQGLKDRNRCMKLVAENIRKRISEANLTDRILLNEAKALEVGMMDVCTTPELRKLMFMLQFEVVLQLQALWQDRLDGFPNAPLLRYVGVEKKGSSWPHVFDIISGSVEPPVEDRAFYDYLLVAEPDQPDSETVPPEIYFDDLSLCSLFFPLTRYTRHKWDEQLSTVKENVFIANVNDTRLAGGPANRKPHSQALMQVFYTGKSPTKGGLYRISRRLVDFNFNRVLLNLVTMDFDLNFMQEQVPFIELITERDNFAHMPSFCGDKEIRTERQIVQGLNDLAKIGVGDASALVLKHSQHRASMRMIVKRLSVVWGPPGAGKTYTLALSTLRLIEVLGSQAADVCPYILVTAMTHAAIDAIISKLEKLMRHYRALKGRDSSWLDAINLERVRTGSTHKGPTKRGVYIYAGTTFQLYKFCEKANLKANLLIIDEAGQLALGIAALAIRWLSKTGKLVLAGDHQQLAPILGTSYPELESVPLFGSILDTLMGKGRIGSVGVAVTLEESHESDYDAPVVQLLENFRLNGDLSDFVETIYAKEFVTMKSEATEIAESLRLWLDTKPSDDNIMEQARMFLFDLAGVMGQRKPPPSKSLTPPRVSYDPRNGATLTTSLALIRVKALKASILPYEAHVKAEARLAAALVHWLRESFGHEETIFVACPHRIQRSAVRQAILSPEEVIEDVIEDDLEEIISGLNALHVSERGLRIDTVERLQGSEATFVIFLLSHTHAPSLSNHLEFLLSRRRLNVGISRAKSLCILISSRGVLQPSIEALTKKETREGLEFLRDYEDRAWIGDVNLEV